MQGLIENFIALGRQRLMVLAAMATAVILATLLTVGAVTRPDFAPIYSNLSATTANSIEATLANAGFEVMVSEDGSSVSVPRPDTARARMVLAETGMPIDGDPGWELFDNQSGLAMNSFLQKINRMRAMEGELARSIQTIDGIQSARVHLVLPDREPFSREAPSPRASVIIRPEPGRAIARQQAIAVRTLVASAVSELDINRVTVLSASGETILAEADDGTGQGGFQSAKTGIEDRLSQEIQNILTARVGAGNARVHVNVDLTTERQVIVEHSFDPEQQVVRSTESKSENASGTDNPGNVGVENNIPAALADPQGGGATSNSSETDEVVQYEIGNTRREIVREAGEVRRMTVAVLVNGIYTVEGDETVYSERSPEELDRLSELVKSAVGFEDTRGDSVSVDSMRFMDYSMDLGEPIATTLSDRLSESAVSIIRGLLALAIFAIVMLVGVRPVLRSLRPPEELTAEDDPAVIEGAALPGAALPGGALQGADALGAADPNNPQALALDGSDAAAAAALSVGQTAGGLDSADPDAEAVLIEKEGILGTLHKHKIDNLQKMADEKPEEVLRVLRSWLATEEVDA